MTLDITPGRENSCLSVSMIQQLQCCFPSLTTSLNNLWLYPQETARPTEMRRCSLGHLWHTSKHSPVFQHPHANGTASYIGLAHWWQLGYLQCGWGQ